jgi:pimeloyl-ACP methyl ester carboxylesterase
MAQPSVSSLVLPGPQGLLRIHRCGARGVPVLFVHGNGGRASQWDPQLRFLAARRHLGAALDLRGMGGSDAPANGDYSIGGLADDVGAVADRLGFPPFVLVGHSLGASVAACFTGRFPHRLRGLVLEDFGGDLREDGPEAVAALVEGLAPARFPAFAGDAAATCLRGAESGTAAQVLGDLQATPRTSFAGAVLGLLDFDPVAALASAQGVPMLHVHSPFLERQGLTPIHQRVQGMASLRISDCSHWIHLDCPEVFSQVLVRFVEACGAGRP